MPEFKKYSKKNRFIYRKKKEKMKKNNFGKLNRIKFNYLSIVPILPNFKKIQQEKKIFNMKKNVHYEKKNYTLKYKKKDSHYEEKQIIFLNMK